MDLETKAALARQFPDYDMETLPDLPDAWVSVTGPHDPFPVFEIKAGNGAVFLHIDHPDRAQRIPDTGCARFIIMASADGQIDDDTKMVVEDEWDRAHEAVMIEVVALLFAAGLAETIGADALAKVKRRNRQSLSDPATPSGVCASHDFCDANMVMADAIQAATGEYPNGDNPLWNPAWTAAKLNWLTSRDR